MGSCKQSPSQHGIAWKLMYTVTLNIKGINEVVHKDIQK